MFHPEKFALLKKQGSAGLAVYCSLWLTVAYLWLALFYPLMCAPYRAASHDNFDQTTAFEHTVIPFSVVMNTAIDWSKFIVPEKTESAVWLMDAKSTVTGLALTFINVLFTLFWVWLVWVSPRHTVALLLSERLKELRLAPPVRPPRLVSA